MKLPTKIRRYDLSNDTDRVDLSLQNHLRVAAGWLIALDLATQWLEIFRFGF